jgi:NADH-quinone oxidoreductase subunit G
MPKLTIDGVEVAVPQGQTILQAAREGGIDIPTFCYYEKLAISGTCRMCTVQVEGMPKLAISCATEARDGMVVCTQTDAVRAARAADMEFLLINHPLDCPVCDQSGDCELQDLSFEYGYDRGRFHERKRTYEKPDVGGKLELEMNRCIHCRRCTRYAQDVIHIDSWGVFERGHESRMGAYAPGINLDVESDFLGNLVDLCPTGAITDKPFRFQERAWNLEARPATRKGCSHGCKVWVWVSNLDGDIKRVTARKNQFGEVTEYICDDCRYKYKAHDDWTYEAVAQYAW